MKCFFELLKIIVGNQAHFSVAPSQKDWERMFVMLQQQSLLGCDARVEDVAEGAMPCGGFAIGVVHFGGPFALDEC